MHPRLLSLALAGTLGTLAAANTSLAGGCGGCSGRSVSVGGAGHVVAAQGAFTTGATYAPATATVPVSAYPQAAPATAYAPAGGPSYAMPGGAFANPDGYHNQGVSTVRPAMAGRFLRRGR